MEKSHGQGFVDCASGVVMVAPALPGAAGDQSHMITAEDTGNGNATRGTQPKVSHTASAGESGTDSTVGQTMQPIRILYQADTCIFRRWNHGFDSAKCKQST